MGVVFLRVVVIAIASLGKFGGGLLGGRIGGMTWAESLVLGCGMSARGSTEVVLGSIGLARGVLDQNLYTVIIAMAVVTTMSMPLLMRWALVRLPMRPEEAARLEREELEAQGFIPQIERLLVAVDASPSGQLASRLVGLLAGARRIPTTVLHFDYASAASPRQPAWRADARAAAGGRAGRRLGMRLPGAGHRGAGRRRPEAAAHLAAPYRRRPRPGVQRRRDHPRCRPTGRFLPDRCQGSGAQHSHA